MARVRLSPGERLFQEERKASFRREEFSFIHTGIIDEDGEIAKHPSYELVTHTYYECYNHNVTVQNISQSEDIDIAKAHLLCTELCNIIISIRQNSNINEDEYLEFLFKQINDWIDEGYTILSQYDIEVVEDGEEDSEG